MMKILKIGLIALLSLTLSNCSTYTVKKDISKKGALTKTPKWYIKYKREDKSWMYETASSVSPDLELAVKKSTLLAKAKLADRINGKMNNQSSISKSETGNFSLIKSSFENFLICSFYSFKFYNFVTWIKNLIFFPSSFSKKIYNFFTYTHNC